MKPAQEESWHPLAEGMQINGPSLQHKPCGISLSIETLSKESKSIAKASPDPCWRNNPPSGFLDHHHAGLPHGNQLQDQLVTAFVPDLV